VLVCLEDVCGALGCELLFIVAVRGTPLLTVFGIVIYINPVGAGVVVAGDSTGALFILRLVDVLRKAEAHRLEVPLFPPPLH
jgi:hypothetical protein